MPIRDWLHSINKTPEWLAETLGRPANTVRAWISGRHRPREPRVLAEIERLSGGKVTALDVLTRPTPHDRPGRPKPQRKAAA